MTWYCGMHTDSINVYYRDKLQGTYPLLKKPFCNVCSNPGINTESCSHNNLYGFNKIYSLGEYHKDKDDLLSTHIRRFKKNEEYSHPLGMALGVIAKQLYPELAASDLLVPVPLHKDKLLERRFNQSLQLCRVIQNRLNKPILEVLTKTRNIDMRFLGWEQRRDAVKDLYSINEKSTSILENKRILLVDDVITSGFTVSECAMMLKMVGAEIVNVLAVGRTRLERIQYNSSCLPSLCL